MRIELGKIAAKSFGLSVARSIDKYQIQDEEALADVFKLAIQQDREVIKWVKNFGIKRQEILVELAKFAYTHKIVSLFDSVVVFGVRDLQWVKERSVLIQLGKAAFRSGESLFSFLVRISIRDRDFVCELASLVFPKQGPKGILEVYTPRV